MKFWPHYDAKLEAERGLGEDAKLKTRWAYLARLWPESTPEMFADAYFKAESRVRQFVISDFKHERLPETLPVDFRLGVYQLMLERAKALPAAERSIPILSFVYKKDTGPKNEIESIKRAIAILDCPEGASAYAEVWAPNCFKFLDGEKDLAELGPGMKSALQLQFSYMSGVNYEYGDHQHKDGPWHFFCWPDADVSFLPRDDRIENFAKHENPRYRQVAIAVIRERPTPRLVRLLDLLVSDEDAEVKSFALLVKAELDELAATPLSHFSSD